MPIFVALLAAFTGYLYAWANVQVIAPAAALYAVAGIWYAMWGRHHVLAAAPEEAAARIAEKLSQRNTSGPVVAIVGRRMPAIELATSGVLLAGLLSLVWMVLRATHVVAGPPATAEILGVTLVWLALFILVSIVGLYSTRRR
jgi:hypothetical protein